MINKHDELAIAAEKIINDIKHITGDQKIMTGDDESSIDDLYDDSSSDGFKEATVDDHLSNSDEKTAPADDELSSDLYDESSSSSDEAILHGYNNMAKGCGQKIQLENPHKKELLVRILPDSRLLVTVM